MAKSNSWVNVDRVFMPYKSEADWELAYYNFGKDDSYIGSQNWEDVLAFDRTVVLSEAGAGKTAEFREQAHIINNSGNSFGFYFPLNILAKKSLEETLDTEDLGRQFSNWLTSEKEAIFFADSLDEAILNGSTFREALAHLKKGLGDHAHRAKVIISCRHIDWQDFNDIGVFETFLPASNPLDLKNSNLEKVDSDEALLEPLFKRERDLDEKDDEENNPIHPHINVVALAPLTRRQASEIAKHSGVDNVKQFFEEIEKCAAADLATRPLDLLELIDYWKKYGKISTKKDALEWSLKLRLTEKTQAKKSKVLAFKFKGRRFDCGSVEGFAEATNYFYDKEYN